MNIVLSQQAADFILKFIRNDLTILQANHNKTKQSYDKLNKILEEYKDSANVPLYQVIKKKQKT